MTFEPVPPREVLSRLEKQGLDNDSVAFEECGWGWITWHTVDGAPALGCITVRRPNLNQVQRWATDARKPYVVGVGLPMSLILGLVITAMGMPEAGLVVTIVSLFLTMFVGRGSLIALGSRYTVNVGTSRPEHRALLAEVAYSLGELDETLGRHAEGWTAHRAMLAAAESESDAKQILASLKRLEARHRQAREITGRIDDAVRVPRRETGDEAAGTVPAVVDTIDAATESYADEVRPYDAGLAALEAADHSAAGPDTPPTA